MRVLLTNDDGPPGKESPYIYQFSKFLQYSLGWETRVVIPSSQKSWIGKAFHIKEVVKGVYYYPRSPDGTGSISEYSRPLQESEKEEWILLDATPATCVNIALHNLYPNQIDLVVSGPNLGRNSSAAFALSSGTIGAAMSSSVSRTPSMAVSYGTVIHPTPLTFHEPAHNLACRIISEIWSKWSRKDSLFKDVGLFNINIPMIPQLLSSEGLPVFWTTLWRNSYGRLFEECSNTCRTEVAEAGPDSDRTVQQDLPAMGALPLTFRFAPDFQGIISPDPKLLPEGCDAWALAHGSASVTPLAPSFVEIPIEGLTIASIEERLWKL